MCAQGAFNSIFAQVLVNVCLFALSSFGVDAFPSAGFHPRGCTAFPRS